jgi:hypothetical protein
MLLIVGPAPFVFGAIRIEKDSFAILSTSDIMTHITGTIFKPVNKGDIQVFRKKYS